MAETQNSKQNVQAPQAGQTVIVNAIPGQDIVLETAFDQAEVKMDGGNVVFEFANGGQVVLDFTDMGEAQAPNVVMSDGTILNVQEFLASLGEKDIEPAAGPEGGADGSGGVGEYQDDAGDLLGGVNKLNGLEDDPFPAFTLASIDAIDDNPLPTAGIVGGAVDEDGLRLSEGAHFDGNDDEAGGDDPARFSYLDGTLTYDFGGDGPAGTNPFVWSLVGLPTVFSEGNQLVYEVVDGGLTLNAYYMTEGEPYFPPQGEGDYMYARVEEGPVRVDVFSLKLTDLDNGTFRFELYQPLDHSDATTEDDINYGFTFTVTDGSGDSVVGGLNLAIDDDSPVVTADGSELPSMVLDESSFGSGIVDAPQETANSDIAHAISLDGHFTLGSNPDVANSESTPFVSINAVGNNNYDYYSFTVTQPNTTVVFDIDYASGAGNSFDSTLRLYDSAGTNLTYSDDANSSLGGGGSVSGLDSYLEWNFATPGTYYVQVGQWANGPISGNGSYQLQISLPNAIMGGGEGDGIRALTTDFSGNFDFNFGADGPEGEGVNYALSLGGESIESGIFALGEDGQPGEQIMLSLDESGTIIGTTEGSSPYFSISVDAETGKVTFVQYQNVFHSDATNHDDAVSIHLLEGSILLTATATDGDGDTASASLDLSSGIFAIEDDGPSVVGEPMSVTIDEANINTDYSVGTEPGAGPALISGTLAGLVDFGTDGQGHFAFTEDAAAQLEALGLASKQSFFGLQSVALEYSVTQDGDFAVLTATEPDINPWSGDTSNPVFELRLNTVTGQYEFRLYDELVHTGEQDNVVGIDFGSMIKAVDADGDSVVLEEAFTIDIQDDEPIANDDSRSINEDTYGLIVGNVTSNDVNGADESLDFKSWDSPDAQYGIFRGYSNGTYSYNLDNALAQQLDDGESWTETFDYSIRDTDGDISTATLTITIEGRNDRPTISVTTGNRWNADDHVDEAALPSGSDPDSNAEYAYGTFKVADPDGLDDIKSVTINGETFLIADLVGQEVDGDSGTLTITSYNAATGVAEYKYVLAEATTDVAHKLEADKFTLETSDGDLTSAKAYINIVIDDDQPIARNDTDTVDVGESGNHPNMATGNVITGADTDTDDLGADTPGADQPAHVTRIGFDADENGSYQGSSEVETVGSSGASIDGKYGTLFIKQDGSYEYTVDPQKLSGATTLTPDSDGWHVETKAFQLNESFFNEDGEYSGTGTGNVTSGGNFPATGVESADDASSAPDQINYEGSLSEALAFEFGGPVASATITVSNLFQNESGGEALRWHAFDADGVRIASGIISNNAGGVYANTTNVIWDSNNVGTFTVADIGTFATIVVEALPYSNDGSVQNDDSDFFATVVSYDALPEGGTEYQDVFKYELTDADGDHSYATLTINGVEPNPEGDFVNQAPVAEDNNYSLEEPSIAGNIITDDNDGDGAATGRDWDADTPVTDLSVHSVSWTADGEPHTLDLNGAQQVVNLQYGTLTINPDGSYTYALNEGANGETDTFTYTLEDVHGAVSGSAEVTFTMPDSVPVAYDNYAVAEEGSVSPVNLVVVLDTSGSMFDSWSGGVVDLPGGGSTTRLALAKNALNNLYETYGDNLQNVMFVTFDTDAIIWKATSDGSGGWTFSGTNVAVGSLDADGEQSLAAGDFWMTADAAASALDSSTIDDTKGGSTDYEDALAAVVGGLDGTSSPSDLATYVYFLSDGNPNDGPINSTERGHWVNFVNQLPLNIQEVYSIGIGDGVDADELATVAWSSTPGQNNVIEVDDATELPAVLEGTVDIQSGNVITDTGVDGTDEPGSDGWGSPVLLSVEYGSNVFAFSASVTEHSIDTVAGTVVIRSDGSYDFTPLTDVKDDVADQVKYTVQDGDGSSASAYLHLATTDSSEVVAVDDMNAVEAGNWVVAGTKTLYVEDTTLVSGTTWAEIENDQLWIGDGLDGIPASRDYNFSVGVANSVVPAVIRFQIDSSDYDNANDHWTAEVFRADGTSTGITVTGYNQTGNSYHQLEIPEAGNYYVRFTADAQSSNNNYSNAVAWRIDDVQIKLPVVQTVQNPVQVNELAWVAGMIAGNILTDGEDLLGSEGAVIVGAKAGDSDIDGTPIPLDSPASPDANGVISIVGGHGSLTLYTEDYNGHHAGDYLYQADADAMGGNVDIFTYQVAQPDGDFDTATLTINVQDHTYAAPFITDNAAGLDQDAAAGVIVGTDGDDVLIGTDGNDTLTGGAGDDIMIGGEGQDTFKYGLADLDGGLDQILDFKLGTGGDELDLSGIFGGQDVESLRTGGFLDVSLDTDPSILNVRVDLDGNAMTTNDSVDISVTYTADSGVDVINTMLDQIKTDI
jgi:VCBS repeat-containing protein